MHACVATHTHTQNAYLYPFISNTLPFDCLCNKVCTKSTPHRKHCGNLSLHFMMALQTVCRVLLCMCVCVVQFCPWPNTKTTPQRCINYIHSVASVGRARSCVSVPPLACIQAGVQHTHTRARVCLCVLWQL